MTDENELEGRSNTLNRIQFQNLHGQTKHNYLKTSVRTANVPTEIGTKNFLNTSLEHYCYANPSFDRILSSGCVIDEEWAPSW
jgi:hypothetical protein